SYFLFRSTDATDIYTLSLHDALPILKISTCFITQNISGHLLPGLTGRQAVLYASKLKNHASVDHEAIAQKWLTELGLVDTMDTKDRKSTRLNSSHVSTSYAVFCLKKT